MQIIYNEWKETDKPLIELLQFLAYLDPDRTPIEILQLLMFNNISLESYSSLNILLNKLAAFKLIEYQANTQFVKIHRSIQQALPLIESSDQQTTLIRLLGLISQQVLYPETMNIHFHSLLPNLIMLAQTIVLRGANLLSPQQKCQLSDWLYSAGQWYLNLGNLQMATSLTEQAFQMLTNTEAEDHNDMAIRYTNFAAAYQNLGDNSKFKSSLILAINNTYLNHTENLDVTITKISSDITKKIRSLENALKNFEAEHTVVAKNIKELIGYYNQTNQHEENIALLLRYQKHMQIKWGGGLTTINILTNLAISYGKLHQFEKEKDALIQVLEIYKRTHGEQDIQVAITLLQLAEVYQSLKNTDEQTNTLQAAWNIFQTKDANSINSFITALTLGKVCLQTKNQKKQPPS
ncbi:MAG: tetratricopeptide repeat protein [Coxiellaceae bacterium]|nr:MAG: tetratricopeptide repeat protein [Coxiellaceae bacterium]